MKFGYRILLVGLFLLASFQTGQADTSVGGTISVDTTWTIEGSPYIVTSYITIDGTDGADGITTLTIDPGVEVRFKRNNFIRVGNYTTGALKAQGTSENPILFTSNEAVPAPGDWSYIIFQNSSDDATSIMDHCIVEYAGAGSGAIYIDNASPTVQNTTIRNCNNSGIYMRNSSATLTGNTISDCAKYGIYLLSGSPNISNTVFSNNGNNSFRYQGTVGGSITGCTIENGIKIDTGGPDTISGNTINYNNSRPIRIGADSVGQLVTENTFNNLDATSYMQVNGETISTDATWTSALKYHILGYFSIDGTDGADGITTLTIEPGAEIRFNKNTFMRVGNYNTGALKAQGTSESPILFTSNEAVPAPGDWFYVEFLNASDDATCVMEHCVVEYGGAGSGAIYLYNASPSIKNTTFRYCKNAGIYARGTGTSSAQIECNTFLQNDKGIHWISFPPPEMHQNNFIGNTGWGLHYTGADTLNAEDNWWNTDQGPNAGGDTFSGNIDADPWSTSEHACAAEEENLPPNIPSSPVPADAAVRVTIDSGVTLSWTGGDPNVTDVVTYDLYWGTAAEALTLEVSDLTQNTHTKDPVTAGMTYYWQVIAKDDKGAETPGPVWHFTTDGDPPDLIVSSLVTDPTGNLQSGQSITLTATVQNTGSGPVVDAFDVDFEVDGASIGSEAVDAVMLAGTSMTVSRTWTYAGGDPTIEITADNLAAVTETDEQNNVFSALLSEVSDITPPVLVSTSPTDGAHLQQLQSITATLADAQNAVDDAAVIGSFSVTGSISGVVAGSTTEAADTFTFVPASLPLADDTYTVSLTAEDNLGNAQGYQFSFTIDTTPPGQPVITGSEIDSGIIQVRPAANTAVQFMVELTGSRDPDTSVWINGVERVSSGDTDWSVQITLDAGSNAFEVWLQDHAGNIGLSEWVDIEINTGASVVFEYDDAGRVRRIDQP